MKLIYIDGVPYKVIYPSKLMRFVLEHSDGIKFFILLVLFIVSGFGN